MLRVLAAAVVVMVAGTGPVCAQDGKAAWSVVGLRIDKPLPKQFDQNLSGTGVVINLVLHLPDKYVVGLDYAACKLDSATDDMDRSLLPDPKKAGFQMEPFWPDFRGGQVTGPYFLAVVKVPGWPGPTASKIRLKGCVIALCGIKPKSIEVKDVPLQAGVKTPVGPAACGLDPFQGPKETVVQLKSPMAIKSVVFLGAGGETLPHVGSVLELSPGKSEYTGLYHLQGKVANVTVRFTYFEDRERVTVPLDVEVGLGL
jgi:hypothetical protein